ncbi:Na+/H+ antiporter NhaC family protein [Halobacterium yunchengense]|uniref:Na+/H+ antiporter NhaC family protein n=1 Tax=Halobacterium yunchengense TaxID=3108497 RepID=UPI00300AC8E4
MSEFGALSVVPPVLAIALAIVTRKAVLSLFLGVWSGAVIFTGGVGLEQTFTWIAEAISQEDSIFHAQIIIFTLLLGSGVAMMWRLGGSYAVRDWAIERVDTKRKAGFVAWLLGLLLFFDDYANTAVVGSTMKDVSDHLGVSREKLSYIVDSTAAPVATLAISSWVAFQLSMIDAGYEAAGVTDRPGSFEIFLQAIPFNVYSILAIAMVAIVVLSRRDYGEMLAAEHRASTTGNVTREDATPMQDVEDELGEPDVSNPRLTSFFGPIAVLVVVTIGSALWTGYSPSATLYDMVTGADYALALIFGSFAMVASTYALGLAFGTLTLGESVDTTIDGFGIMLTAVTILVLAWSIGNVVSALETGDYVAAVVEQFLSPELLPVVVLFTAAFVAFSTGSSWGTMSIVTPIAVPVAWELTGTHTMVAAVVGVVFSGAIFGDHSSPISDTTVLSATFTGADLIDHVRTQLYYAVTVVVVAAVLLVVWGYTRVTPLALLPVGVLALVGLVYAFSEFDASRRGISAKQSDEPPAAADD